MLFVDGWGLSGANIYNPFSLAILPNIKRLWGGLTNQNIHVDNSSLLIGLDATFGIEGLPQSASGQAALFTGLEVPRILGEHRPGFPGPEIIALLKKRNLFTVSYLNRWRPTFANTYTRRYLSSVARGKKHASCTTVMCRMVPGGLRFTQHYRQGLAITHDLIGRWLRQHGIDVPQRTAYQAGCIIRRILRYHRLVLFEHFVMDGLGHEKALDIAKCELSLYDEFLGAVMVDWDERDWIILASDHGNVEDMRTKSHTLNPTLLAGHGEGIGDVLSSCRNVADLGRTLIRLMR